jgi:CrcB protein
MNLLAVALGGALGALARYGVTALMHRLVPGSFPIGTATVNVVGGLAVGFIAGLLAAREVGAPPWHLFLIVGVCGGFDLFRVFA